MSNPATTADIQRLEEQISELKEMVSCLLVPSSSMSIHEMGESIRAAVASGDPVQLKRTVKQINRRR